LLPLATATPATALPCLSKLFFGFGSLFGVKKSSYEDSQLKQGIAVSG